MTALAWSCQSKLKTQWVSLKRFIDGHGHNNDILGYEQCVEKRYSFLCVLKCLNKWNGRTKYSLQCLYFVTFVVLIWIERNSKCAKQTIRLWWIDFFLFINNANLMTRKLLLETFLQPNIVIHQPNFWMERKNGGHLHFSNVYLCRHTAVYSPS